MPASSRPLIRLDESLTVEFRHLDRSSFGKLIELNSDAWKIDVDAEVDFGGKHILVTLTMPGGRQVSCDVQFEGDRFIAANVSSAAVFLDTMHRLRKEQHISICTREDVESSTRRNGFESINLPHVSLPDLSWDELNIDRTFMGRKFGAPILITGMTGGVERATEINERLAIAATKFNIPMGIGSQRVALENADHAGIFSLKNKFPNLFLLGNIGVGQLRGSNYVDLCKRAVEMIQADGLAIHLNVLQELVQVEGDRDFRGLHDRIGEIAAALAVPVMVKEVGAGLDVQTAKLLFERGIRYFDVGGNGGTSWAHIEGLRSSDASTRRLGQAFRDWGIPTAEALMGLSAANLVGASFVATGGIRDGVAVLKALHCGATMVGMGLPLFRAALISEQAPVDELTATVRELKVAMMCSGRKGLD